MFDRRFLLRNVLIGLFVVTVGVGRLPADEPLNKAAPNTVRLVVDYGDGVEKHFTRLQWKSGQTVLDVLQAASRQSHGIRIVSRGKGETAFLTQIDDVTNEGQGRNWQYRVNGKLSDRGMGVVTVNAGDVIRWAFEPFQTK